MVAGFCEGPYCADQSLVAHVCLVCDGFTCHDKSGGSVPGSFSFRTWGCTAGANELKGFVPHGVLLAQHASHEPKPFPKVDPYDSTASAPHRGLRRDSRLSSLSG